MLIVSEDAGARMLALMLSTEPLRIGLYTEALEGSPQELVRTGYGGIDLRADEWTITPGIPADAAHTPVRWNFSDGPEVAIRGYMVSWLDGQCAWHEPFKRPQIVEFDGDSITVVPKFELRELTVAA